MKLEDIVEMGHDEEYNGALSLIKYIRCGGYASYAGVAIAISAEET